MIIVYVLIAIAFFAGLLAISIRVYGPRTNRQLKVGMEYKVKGQTRAIGDLRINDNLYLMRDHILDDFYDLVKYTDALLNNSKIPYTAAYGTLLGAIRHKGIMPWDDDADFYVYAPYQEYQVIIPALKEQIDKDGYVLRKNYDTDYYHITKKGAKNNYPYLDLYYYTGKYGDESNVFPIKRAAFEDFEINVPNKPEKCIDVHYNLTGNGEPLKEVVNDYPLSRYYSLWIAQILKKRPYIHAPLEWVLSFFVKLF